MELKIFMVCDVKLDGRDAQSIHIQEVFKNLARLCETHLFAPIPKKPINEIQNICAISIAPVRFVDILFLPDDRSVAWCSMLFNQRDEGTHQFSYDIPSSLSRPYSEDVYLGLMQLNKSIYVDALPEKVEYRWYPSDVKKLEHDRGVDKLYSYGGFDVLYVHALGE